MIFKSRLIYIFYIFILIITTNFVDLIEGYKIFSDQSAYYKLIYAAPGYPNEAIQSFQAQRFFFPFIIGTIINFFTLENHINTIMIIINIILIFSIILVLVNLFEKENIDKLFYPFLIAILIFNPYFARSFIHAPLVINDLIFSLGSIFLILGLKEKNILILIIATSVCALSRQTAMLIIPLFIILFIFEKKIRTDIKRFWYLLLSLEIILIFYITLFISSEFSENLSFKNVLFGIFYFDYSFYESFLFIIRLYIANFIILLFILKFFIDQIYHNYDSKKITFVLICLFLAFSFWVQPILAGPKIGAGNEARLTVLSLPIFVYCIGMIMKNLYVKKKYLNFTIFLLIISSLHHEYSVLKKISIYNNITFACLSLIISIIIFTIIKRNFLFKKIKN